MKKTLTTFLMSPLLIGTLGLTAQSTSPSHPQEGAREELQLSPARRAVVVVGGFMTKEKNFTRLLETVSPDFDHVQFVAVGQNPLQPDHVAEFEQITEIYEGLREDGFDEIFAIGYSLGGKHVGRLAYEQEDLTGAVLLDPVDGGPAFGGGEKTPIFLDEGEIIRVPTALLWSEHGERAKLFGKACVPSAFGSKHFMKHIEPAVLLMQEEISGTGHLNFLSRPWSGVMKLACDNGTADPDVAEEEILTLVSEFVARDPAL